MRMTNRKQLPVPEGKSKPSSILSMSLAVVVLPVSLPPLADAASDNGFLDGLDVAEEPG